MEPLSDSELLAVRCQERPEDLERVANQVAKSRLQFNAQFEKAHANRIKRYGHLPGSLVLVRNSAVELSHSRKDNPTVNQKVESSSLSGTARCKEGCTVFVSTSTQWKASFRLVCSRL